MQQIASKHKGTQTWIKETIFSEQLKERARSRVGRLMVLTKVSRYVTQTWILWLINALLLEGGSLLSCSLLVFSTPHF